MQKADAAIILTKDADNMRQLSVIGSGGWLSPEEREVLDWMTLIAVLGWKVQLHNPDNFQTDFEHLNVKWIIVTSDPDNLDNQSWERLLSIISQKNILLVIRAGKKNGWLADHFHIWLSEQKSNGDHLEYNRQQGNKWKLQSHVQLQGLEFNNSINELVYVNETCIAASFNQTNGKILFLSFHPSKARDIDPAFTALLKDLLIKENLNPVVWFDWENTVILRMDDPGSGQPVHDNSFNSTKLGDQEWSLIGDELLKRNARISLAYVPAWVDDGDNSRGSLEIGGQAVIREGGKIYPSPLVKYYKGNDKNEQKIFDYESEYNGIQKLRKEGLAEVELHGYTHMHPDREAWLRAEDRYENKKWFREFGRTAVNYIKDHTGFEHPLYSGLKSFVEIFKTHPSTLVCPGEEFTNEVLEKALKSGLNLVSSYYLGMRIGQQLCWNYYICSPYLDSANPRWFISQLPVVGYFHDFDISTNGVSWFAQHMDKWQEAGAKHFIDFKEFSNVLDHGINIIENPGEIRIDLISEKNYSLIKPVRMGIYLPSQNIHTKVTSDNNTTVFKLADLETSVSL